MPCALTKNPIVICSTSFSIKLAKPNFFMSVFLPFNKIKNAHIIPPLGKFL